MSYPLKTLTRLKKTPVVYQKIAANELGELQTVLQLNIAVTSN